MIDHGEVAALAEKAAEEIERRGWCQGNEINSYGEVCMRGGLLSAVGCRVVEAKVVGYGIDKRTVALDEFMLDPSGDELLDYTEERLREWAIEHLPLDDDDSYEAWNDQEGRTKYEVIDALKQFSKWVQE